jgi:hypothetical protein
MNDTQSLQREIEAARPWYFSIELAPGIVTPGTAELS